uniref:Uncharacterized protein n=1 Tax=uncultured marine virus TaxID=186617 RepID=A0A0F7L4K8_9VIRU|nr:hypothetical protein [uncultured marine virus]
MNGLSIIIKAFSSALRIYSSLTKVTTASTSSSFLVYSKSSLSVLAFKNLLGTKPQYSVILTESDSSAILVSGSKPKRIVS